MVTREGNKDINGIVTILTNMSSMYGPSQTDWTKFQLFNSMSCDNASSTKPPKSVSTKPTISVSTKTTPYAVIVLLVAMVAVMSL